MMDPEDDFDQELRASLNQRPVPMPVAGLAQRVLDGARCREAARRRLEEQARRLYRRGWLLDLAACAVLASALAAGLFKAWSWSATSGEATAGVVDTVEPEDMGLIGLGGVLVAGVVAVAAVSGGVTRGVTA